MLSFKQLQLACQDLNQSGFARAVSSQNGDTAVHVNTEVDILVEDFFGCVAEQSILDFQQRWGNLLGLGKFELDRLLYLHFFDHLHLFELFDSALSHRGTGIVGSEFGHDGLILSNFDLLFFILFHLIFLVLLKCLLEGVVVALVIGQLALEKVNSMRAHVIQELSGVGNDYESLLTVLNIVFQPENSVHIEMVRRLIQKKNIRLHKQGSGQTHAHSPSTR